MHVISPGSKKLDLAKRFLRIPPRKSAPLHTDSAPAFVNELNNVLFPTLGNPTIPNFISLNISFKCIDFTVFSDVFTVLSLF